MPILNLPRSQPLQQNQFLNRNDLSMRTQPILHGLTNFLKLFQNFSFPNVNSRGAISFELIINLNI